MTEAHQGSPEPDAAPGFAERGRMRRRLRFLRKARELAYRDLGGLVFDLHRFGERNDPLVSAKLATLRQIDAELRALQEALGQRRAVTVLHEVGIAACPRCAAIHGGDDRFCPGCGLAFDAHAERPLATAPMGAHTQIPPTGAFPPAPPQTGVPTPTAATPQAGPAPPTAGATAPSVPAAPAPPAKETAPPVAAPRPADEDEPTQVLRPPVRGG